jgi:hypothetical protein
MIQFVKAVIENNGTIKPLLVPADKTKGTGLFNPTIFNNNGKIIGNIRHCQYTIYHSELGRFHHDWGPLVYLHPENDITLTTTNYYYELDDNLDITTIRAVDTSGLDQKPLWEFVGLEDVRIAHWDNKLYYCGVRRDTTTNGQGRMEISQIEIQEDTPVEVARYRMPAPGLDNSYCEKNWMPVLDQPFTFVKWSNPTQVVKFHTDTKETKEIYLGTYVQKPYDYRGGSQVIPWRDYYVSIVHSVNLYKSESGKKNADYFHNFIVWDRNWNVVKYTDRFNFMGAKIEFACGMCHYNNNLLITFGYQDNSAFLLQIPENFFARFLNV